MEAAMQKYWSVADISNVSDLYYQQKLILVLLYVLEEHFILLQTKAAVVASLFLC